QPIRAEGPKTNQGKKGTPTMGGVVFILATIIAYLTGHLILLTFSGGGNAPSRHITVTGVVLLGLFLFMGVVGFIDDFLKVRKRNSLGLNKRGKLIGTIVVGAVFGILALYFPNKAGNFVASEYISFARPITWLNITKVGAVVVFVAVVMSAWPGVDLTARLDGLARGR